MPSVLPYKAINFDVVGSVCAVLLRPKVPGFLRTDKIQFSFECFSHVRLVNCLVFLFQIFSDFIIKKSQIHFATQFKIYCVHQQFCILMAFNCIFMAVDMPQNYGYNLKILSVPKFPLQIAVKITEYHKKQLLVTQLTVPI